MTSPDQPGPSVEDTHDVSESAPGTSPTAQQEAADQLSLSGNKIRWLWITLSVVAAAGLSAALIGVATGGGAHPGTSGGPPAGPGAAPGITSGSSQSGRSHAAHAPKGTSTSKNAVTSAAQLAAGGGALTLPSGMKNSAVSWASGPGGKDLAAVSARYGNALQAAGIRQYSAMRYACIQLARSVPVAQNGPQIPDIAMQKLYATALGELARGAADCQSAISSEPAGDETMQTRENLALLHRSLSELTAGARDTFRATAEIEIASRQRH